MKTTKIMLSSLALLLANLTFSQTDTTNFLRDYKAPDFQIKKLDIIFLGDGTGYLNKYSTFNIDLNLKYASFYNSSLLQKAHYLSINSDFYYDEKKMESLFVNHFRASLRNRFSRRQFFNKEWFLGVADGSNITLISHYKSESGTESKNINVWGDLMPSLSIGKGRVELVNFARKSEDINRMLQKSNFFNGGLDEEQKSELADKIAVIQNRRFFDSRLNRIYQLESIDSILKDMSLVSLGSARYYAELADAFLYSHDEQRLSGDRFEFSLINRLSFGEFNSTTYTSLSYQFYLPVSYKFQHDFNVSLIGSYSPTAVLSEDVNGVYGNYGYKIGFFPNTRTHIGARVVGSKNLIGSGYRCSGYLDLSYYLSPRFRINLNGSITRGDGESYWTNPSFYYNDFSLGNAGGNGYNFRLGLNYAIF